MAERWQCWRCGAELSDIPRPYGRRAQCPACRADLHVCLMCRHHDTSKAKQCREPVADEVREKTRANPCEWFQARPGAWTMAAGQVASPPRSELDALFGNPTSAKPPSDDPARRAPDDLFRGSQ